MTPSQRIDDELCERLILRACEGDEEVWKDLTLHLWPHFQALVRSSRAMGNMAKSEDHVHNVLTNLVDKLGTDGGRAITQFPRWKEQNPGKTFSDWIRIVTSYTVNDYVRAALGRRKQATPGEEAIPSIKRLLNEFASAPISEDLYGSNRPAFTAAQTARQLLTYAETTLAPEQMQALSQWLDGASFEEMDAELGADTSKKLVRAAIAVLRRKFGVPAEE